MPEPTTDEPEATPESTNWQFFDTPPTVARVHELLDTLPPCYGVEYVDFIDYVQALPQKVKTHVPHPDPERAAAGVKVEQKRQTWSLYMSVAGRVKMLEQICYENSWQADFEPEPVTPTGAPGILAWEPKLVYREYLVIRETTEQAGEIVQKLVGRKPGTADVPAKGGEGAAGTNPYSKVETSARGRAIAAYGIGILPGSGIASVEEMQSTQEPARQPHAQQDQEDETQDPQELVQEILALGEQIRQLANETDEWLLEQQVTYLHDRLGVRSAFDEETRTIDWKKPKIGQLRIMRNAMRTRLRRMQAEGMDTP